MGDTSPSNLYSLPNEIFVQILSPLPTSSLLSLALVSCRFHALVLRILYHRLRIAASLQDYQLMLECFHPSSKLTEPNVFCSYLGTEGLSDSDRYEEPTQKQKRLGSLYSRFRPERTADQEEEERRSRLRARRQGSTDEGEDSDGRLGRKEKDSSLVVKRTVDLDGHEHFSQLCVIVHLVKVRPGSSLVLSAVTIKDGIIRLWRDWLSNAIQANTGPEGGSVDQRMLWVDQEKNVGLQIRVREKKWNQNFLPVLIHREEEPVSYEVELEELHIRTTHLLLAVEKSVEEQQNPSQAVIFGAYYR